MTYFSKSQLLKKILSLSILLCFGSLQAGPEIEVEIEDEIEIEIEVDNIQNYNNTLTNKIDKYLSKISKKRFSGAVLIDYQGEKIFSKGYGLADRVKGIEYTPNTISDIGSVTKQFTAAAILKLESQGKLSVDDKLSKYFKNVPKDKSNITLHEILTMSAGFHIYSDNGGGDFEAVTNDEFIKMAMGQELLFEPGKGWEYSNTSYSILALIIERVSGLSYESYLYKNLFEPADMMQTGYSRPQFLSQNVAVQHSNGKSKGKPTEKPWDGKQPYLHLKGNGGILSTTEDLYKWHIALLSDKILSPKAKGKYFKAYVKASGESNNDSYAYGWFVKSTSRKTKLIHHSGGNGSAFAFFNRFIDEDITIIIVSNDNDGFNSKINEQIIGMVFDQDFIPLEKTGYKSLDELFNKKIKVDDILVLLNKEINANKPSDYNFSERSINHLGYSYVKQNMFDEALKIFKLNVELFPKSPDVYDSYGETLIVVGKIKEGLESYKHALKLNPNYRNAQQAIKVIEKYN